MVKYGNFLHEAKQDGKDSMVFEVAYLREIV